MYLHELLRIIQKAESDEFLCSGKRDPERTQLLPPVPSVGTDDRFHVILVNGGILITNCPDSLVFFQVETDLLVIMERDLRIGNDGSRKNGMCALALRTPDPAYPEAESSGRNLYIPIIVTVNGKTGRMATGTGQLMKLEHINNRIIKGLRNLIAILSKNGYHSIVDRHR